MRKANGADQRVQFERNVRYFNDNLNLAAMTKREIDISVFREKAKPEVAIELKYPKNGQHPESMFSFCKDIRFLEELKEKVGFNKAWLLVLADDPLFYAGNAPAGSIYRFFRGDKSCPVEGRITKPTGKKNETLCLKDATL